uniref:Neuritin 1b n=1 Tax=Mastacembelus armatus TaxID=205130 RepID=A0A3Q3RT60_9TELE
MGFFMSAKIGGILAFALGKICPASLCFYVTFLCVSQTCENIYKDFSDCVLELGESMDNYQENVTTFHTCALTALSDCQEEVSSIWETLRQDSRKMRFQGSLFDLCSPSSSPSISSPLAALTLSLMLILFNFSTLMSFYGVFIIRQ